MKNINLSNLELLHFEKDNRLFYGGAQDFYPKMIKRWSGCGPTTAANLFAYLGRTDQELKELFPYNEVEEKSILNFMETIWKYITPGVGGIDSTKKFADGAIKYLKNNKINLEPIIYDISSDNISDETIEEVKIFLKKSLSGGVPVAFLNLDNGMVRNLQKWHWVLIVGISFDDGIDALIYDEGEEIIVDIELWLKTVKSRGGFVSFKKPN